MSSNGMTSPPSAAVAPLPSCCAPCSTCSRCTTAPGSDRPMSLRCPETSDVHLPLTVPLILPYRLRKRYRTFFMKPYASVLLIVCALIGASIAHAEDVDFQPLQKRLMEDGIDSSIVHAYFNDPRFELMEELLKINIKQPDATDIYAAMREEESVERTAAFLRENDAVFERVLQDSPVDKEVVAAVLRVETNLGLYKGKHPLMNVFASLALLNSDQLEIAAPNFWDRVMEDVAEEEQAAVRDKVDSRRKRKARWAYRELKLLLQMAQEERMDPLEVKGSWAGAFGLAQFLPSSFEAYARDGSGDGYVDLYLLDDAVASIAHYLKVHGYHKDNQARRRKAVYRYNHSNDYVDTVLHIADRVREINDERRAQAE
ncbi:hypothetical protein GF324_07875 [bacterium]|nr:hypothetical protein [bacterium]